MMGSMISVVIPAYNEEKTLGRTLEGLLAQTYSKPFEVIVVNNNSTDETAAVALGFTDRLSVRVIDEPRKGRGAARHTGFLAALGNIVFSLDADSVPPPNWLTSFMEKLNNPKIIAVTGTCRINDLSPIKNFLFNVIQPASAIVYSWMFRHFWLSGFSFAIRKEIYLASGGFDPALNALEDTDLGFRVMKLGKIKFDLTTPVLVSGRRFKDHFWGGLWSYASLLVKYMRKKQIYLSDERS